MEKFFGLGQKIGEPMITGFNPSELAENLESLGFHLFENLSPVNIEIFYLKGRMDGCRAQELGHIACAVIE
jgi:hypothetical protein